MGDYVSKKFWALTIGAVSVLLLVGVASVVGLSWECKGYDCGRIYPDWKYNSRTEELSHCTTNAEVKGDQDSADFCCVCHRERNNPDPGYWGLAECLYYGPVNYDYAYNHAKFRESSGGGYYDIGDYYVYVYCT